jgi:DNA-binding NtrC family response regulator
MMPAYLLVVDDEPDIRQLLKDILEDEGFEVSVAENADAARHARRTRRPDLILLDIWMPDTDGISLLKEWAEGGGQDIPVVVMSGHGTVETAVEATRLGAYDFIEKPLSIAKLLLTVRRALETAQLKQENISLRQEILPIREPVGRSPKMQMLRDQARRIAQHDTSVLISGGSGVGKQVFARYLHAQSNRSHGPFVRVVVAGMTGASSAVELFGAESGSNIHFGALEKANGGTLFLEDVADMDPSIQASLLSALQHFSYLRVGGVEPVQFNARIIGATCRDLAHEVLVHRFREDLYYHLNVVPLFLPPLRDHREDIPELLDYYVDFLVTQDGLPYRRFSVAAQNRLRNYSWPGNIRELKNVVQRLLILGSGQEIDSQEVEIALGSAPLGEVSKGGEIPAFDLPLKEAREKFERNYLEYQIRKAGGSIAKVAHRVGIERTHLYRKLRALGIDAKQVINTD